MSDSVTKGMTKADFLEQMQTEHDHLLAALAKLTEIQMTQPGITDQWSVKDLLAHLNLWHDHIRQELEAITRGEPPTSSYSAPNDWNAYAVAQSRERPLSEVRAEFERSFEQVRALTVSFSEAQLFSPAAANSDQLLWESIASNTSNHYREHLPLIEAWVARHIS